MLLPASVIFILSLYIALSTSASTRPTFDQNFRYDKNVDSYKYLPKRSELPSVAGWPEGAAWFWGPDDGLGRLNFQTPKRIKRALKESKTGEFTSLNAPLLTFTNPPFFHRPIASHKITNFSGDPLAALNDDELNFNTQTTSHIDGFRHFGEQTTRMFYNGCRESDFRGPDANTKCGLEVWAERGIVGRGILLDVARYRELKGKVGDVLSAGTIKMEELVEVARCQGLDLRRKGEGGDIHIGDILLIRTGFLKAYQALSTSERIDLATKPPAFLGLEPSEGMADFLHDSYFSAVVSDNPAVEAAPLPENFEGSLHEYLIPLWGVPIGEMWDLERLSVLCEKRKGWKFLVTSAPFNVKGGVASWANAIAIL